ncbi:hypothetical protein CPVG_00024 [Cyanophage KBS-S-1A]|nr:hypothetical protein CPVG_00024 [Cyanophage KBS-S-1A]
MLVDGSLPSASSPLRSFVVDSFTQICLDGPGCLVTNNGYAQLVSFFGTFCHYHTKALNGGQANLTNSTTDFGRYGLIADGKSSSAIFTSTANGAASAGDITFAINEPTDNWFGTSTRPLDNMLVQIGSDIYEILSSSPNGLGWNVTISNPNPANRAENLGLDNPHANGVAVSFFLQSFVSTSSHTFEYAGTGTDYRALPQNGGVAIEANQVISRNDGRVWLSSTDQNGKFKVGDTFEVNQRTGFVTIDPQSVATIVISDSTPQLGGDLDVLDKRIYSSSGNVHVNDTLEVNLGSASNPAITFNGDTNTGLYSPGADQVAISTAGSEKLLITSDGKLGLGTSSPDSNLSIGNTNANYRIDIADERAYIGYNTTYGSSGALYLDGGAGATKDIILQPVSTGNVGIGTSSPGSTLSVRQAAAHFGVARITRPDSDTACLYLGNDTDNNALISSNNTALRFGKVVSSTFNEYARIDSLGRLGLGTLTPAYLLHLANNGTLALQLEDTSTSTRYRIENTSGDLSFVESGVAERMRIDSSGRLLVGTSTSANRYGIESQLQVSGASRAASSISLSQTDGASAESGAIYFWSSGRNEVIA